MVSSAPVTLCLRNLPCKVLEPDLEEMTAMLSDTSQYTFYLPKKPGRKGRMNNFGYGFVTCSQQQDADDFTRLFQGFQFSKIDSDKRILIEPSYENRPIGPCSPWNDACYSANSSFAHSHGLGDTQGPDMDKARYWLAADANGGTSSHVKAFGEYYAWTESFGPPSTSLGKRGRVPPNGNEVPQTRLATSDPALRFQ
eukprot:TRINITY_DN6262_c1_g6_i1.p1 TRINITY_DN6262_c1_g6~~TRINITY_DN6262_c1_g6_i1.p1  ORF type:complete len:210 (+),score=16.29 TRINITY_DN6262_c1_g6_i1:41-631(+)